jgi:hypothetical protein
VRTNREEKTMTKFTMAAFAIFALGAIVGRASAPTAALASLADAQISTYELTLKAGPLPVQSADAV